MLSMFKQIVRGRLRWDKLTYYYGSLGLKGLKHWWNEVKLAHKRCNYCGWYIHPHILFDTDPSRYYGNINDVYVCRNCFELYKHEQKLV